MGRYRVSSGGLTEYVEAPDAREAAIRAVERAGQQTLGPLTEVVEVLGAPGYLDTEHLIGLAGVLRFARENRAAADACRLYGASGSE